MKFSVIRDEHKTGSFIPAGSTQEVKYDNHWLHVLYTAEDGKPSVDKLKFKQREFDQLGVKEDLTGKIIEVAKDYFSDRVTSLTVTGYMKSNK